LPIASITDLDGLEYAANLTLLYLNDNLISDIWALTNLKNLTTLHLNNNPLDRAAYCTYLPMISENNPGIDLTYELNPNPGDDCIVDFAEPNLKAAVETQLGISDPNFGDVLNMVELKANLKGIADLTGLEYARNLSWLYLRRNQISDLSVLSKMKYLAWLDLGGNQIESVSTLSRLMNLSWLKLPNNQVSDISAISQLNLTQLKLDGNPLNTAAYCRYMPLFSIRNPAIDLFYDLNPNLLTDDCSTDLSDLAVFALHWLEAECSEGNSWCGWADLNHVDDVDLFDLAEFAEYWLEGVE